MIKLPTLEDLIELYLDRCHIGDAPDLAEFAAEHPEHTVALLETLPIVKELEQIGNVDRGHAKNGFQDLPDLPGSDYKLLKKIGGGGMGVVYEAEQISLQRHVAVKLLAPSLMANQTRREQFEREARLVANLQHPNIIQIIGSGTSASYCYYAMELVKGERLDRHKFKNVREIATAGLQVAEALAYAEDNNIMHRDIKPSNIIIDKAGNCHVADFGLACVLGSTQIAVDRAGARNGTLRYMSAERLIHGLCTYSGDAYALGVTLYELITKRPILEERSSTALFRRICRAPLPSLKYPQEPDFAAIINKCIAFDVRDRYPNLKALADDLRRFLNHEPILATPTCLKKRFQLWIQRKPAVALLSFVVATCMVALVTALSFGYISTADALHLAQKNADLADAALLDVFRSIEKQPPTPQATALLSELLPYYGQLVLRHDMSREKVDEVNRILGVCAYRTGNYTLAEKSFQRLASTRPTARDLNFLAATYNRLGKNTEAQALYQIVAHTFATATNINDRFSAVKALQELSDDAVENPNRKMALQILEELLKQDPQNPDYRYRYARLLELTSPNISIQILQQLTRNYPNRTHYAKALIKQMDRQLTQQLNAKQKSNVSKEVKGSTGKTNKEKTPTEKITSKQLPKNNDLIDTLSLADRLLSEYSHSPDLVSSIVALRKTYVKYLHQNGQHATAKQEAAKTAGMLDILPSQETMSGIEEKP